MQGLLRFVKTTLLGGVLVLLPVYILVVVLITVVNEVAAAMKPVVELLPLEVAFGPTEGTVLAVLLIVIVCFLVGLLVQTQLGQAVGSWFRHVLLDRIPGYGMIRTLVGRMAGAEADAETMFMTPAVVRLQEGLAAAGFVMERLDDGTHVVFVPLAPTATIGHVYYLPAERVSVLEAKGLDVVGVVSHWGVGSGELLAKIAPGGGPVGDTGSSGESG